MRLPSIGLMLITVTSLWGCHAKPHAPPPAPGFSYYRSDFQPQPIRRVVLLPLLNETHEAHAEEVFREALARQLRAAGLFEVITLHAYQLHGLPPPAPSLATYDEQTLIELAQEYRADAVMFGSLRSFHPYWPPRIGVTLHLVETSEATTVASVDGLWDASDASIARQARGYFESQSPKKAVPQSELVLHGPSYFSNFVAYQVTQSLVQESSLASAAASAGEHCHFPRRIRIRKGQTLGPTPIDFEPSPVRQVSLTQSDE